MKSKSTKKGLANKIKGYASGGKITNDEMLGMGATGAASLVDLGTGIAGYNKNNPITDPNDPRYVQQTKNGNLGSGIGSAAGTGIGIGLAAATGGLTTPFIPAFTAAGKLVGKGIGNHFDNKNSENQLDSDLDTFNKNKAQAQETAMFNSNLANQIGNRNSYSKGGKVVGKGTGTSDSIKAKVEAGSFVVPAKNKAAAMAIKKQVLKHEGTEKAELDHPEGEDVRVSNGEVIFSPEEFAEIKANGIDLESLAPDAKNDLRNYLNCGGKVKGYAKGGRVEKPDTKNVKGGKEDEYLAKVQGLYALRNKALNDTDPKNKSKNDTILKYTQDKINTLDATYKSGGIDKSNPKAYQDNLAKKLGVSMPNTGSNTPATSSGLVNKVSSGTSSPGSPKMSSNASESLKNTMANQDIDNAIAAPVGLANKVASPYVPAGNAIDQAGKFDAELAARLAETAPSTTPDYTTMAGKGLSAALNYGLPLAQTAIGLNQLRKMGDRPVDSIDPNYQISLNNADNRTNQAIERASYGFTPEEQALINNNNANATSSQRFAARNYSGGSAGNAYAMERNALNDSYGRGLASSVANRNLQLQKQREANAIARDADAIRLDKVELSRRLFNDKLTGFKENQAAYGGLANTGISNLLGANRYEQQKKAVADRAAIDNSYLTGI